MTSSAFQVGKQGTFNPTAQFTHVILRIGQAHPTADQNDRPFCLLKFCDEPPDLVIHHRQIKTRGRRWFEPDELFGIDESFLNVERDVQQTAPAPLLTEPEGLLKLVPYVVRLHNHLGILGDWRRHCHDVGS